MPNYVMHSERKNPDYSLCGRSVFTEHIRTTKDLTKVTCNRCIKRLEKEQSKTIKKFKI